MFRAKTNLFVDSNVSVCEWLGTLNLQEALLLLSPLYMRKFKLADSSKCRQTNSSQVPFPTEDSTNNNTVCVPDTEFQTIQFLFSSDGDVFFGNIIITLKQCDKSVNFHTVQEYFNKHRSLLSTFFDFNWAKDVSR